MKKLLLLLICCLMLNVSYMFKYFNPTNIQFQTIDISSDYLKWSENQKAKFLLLRKNRSLNMLQSIPTTTTKPISDVKSVEQKSNKFKPDFDNFVKSDQNKLTSTLPNYFDLFLDNDTANITTPRVIYSTPTAVILGLLTGVVSLVTVVGNILVLISFIVERALRTASNYFLASLAVTDVLIGIFSMNLYTLYLLLGHWPLGRLTCDLWLSLDYTACLTSQYTVLLITIDRFCSVSLPAKYRMWRTDTKILIQVAVTWIIPSCVFFTTIMGWPYFNTSMSPRAPNECYAEFANDPIFNTVFTVCYFWITLYVMFGLYVGIYRVALDLQKRSDEKRNRVSGLISMNKNKNDKNANVSTTCNLSITNQLNKSMGKQNNLLSTSQKPFKNSASQNNSSLFGVEDSSGFDSDETKPVNQKRQTCLVKESEPHRVIKIEARCDVQPFNFQPKPNISNVDKTPIQIKPDLHTKSYDTDYDSLTPTSVMSSQIKCCTISSPIVADDDNWNETINVENKFEFPSSPALPDSSDVEDVLTKMPNVIIETKSLEDVVENDDEVKLECAPDPGYQNRVLEQFKQRLAAMNINSMPASANENQRLSQNPSNCITNSLIQVKSTGCVNSPKTICNGKLEYSTQITSANSSPIWKSKCHLADGLVSGQCSMESYQCLICIKQHDSDTLQSSSSYGDYIGVALCDQKCLCHLQTNYESEPTVYYGVRQRFLNILYSIKQFNPIKKLIQYFVRKRKNGAKITERGRRENRARKALRTITFILGAFVLCWTPYHVVIIIKGICDDVEQKYTCVNEIFYSITYWLCYVNSPINPFCYALANEQFKKTFIRILRGDLRRT